MALRRVSYYAEMKTVLIIEDNFDIRDNTAEILELAGFDVLVATNGYDGLQMAGEHFPDIILCDILMPQMNGWEVLVHLKNNHQTANIPFVYLTSSVEKQEERKARELGADGYICKPYEVNELIEQISAVLQSQR